jgi:hypothetical protein
VAERVQVVTLTDGGASFASGAELTVTLALPDGTARAELIQAVRAGEVTLVRSTHLGPVTTSAPPAPPGSAPSSPGGTAAVDAPAGGGPAPDGAAPPGVG